jgi:hypothetical protein
MLPFEAADLLCHDVKAWNHWRSDSAHAVNLTNTNLARADLSGANLRRAVLSGSNLRETSLAGADLSSASLSGADLSGATLDGSQLSLTDVRGAYLIYASLRAANLHGANLNGANLTGADLQGADLNFSVFLETVLADTNLLEAKGLDSSIMLGPSVIDHRTVIRSNGLPVRFLRGCGLPDELIRAYGALNPRFASCFISYSSKDESFVRILHASLQDRGVRCWFAPEDLPIGSKIRPILDRDVLSRDRVLLVLSQNAFTSGWVEKEVETAFEKIYRHKVSVLLPIRHDEAVFETTEAWAADIRRTIHIGDFRNWQNPTAYGRALERLLRDLRIDDPH